MRWFETKGITSFSESLGKSQTSSESFSNRIIFEYIAIVQVFCWDNETFWNRLETCSDALPILSETSSEPRHLLGTFPESPPLATVAPSSVPTTAWRCARRRGSAETCIFLQEFAGCSQTTTCLHRSFVSFSHAAPVHILNGQRLHLPYGQPISAMVLDSSGHGATGRAVFP